MMKVFDTYTYYRVTLVKGETQIVEDVYTERQYSELLKSNFLAAVETIDGPFRGAKKRENGKGAKL